MANESDETPLPVETPPSYETPPSATEAEEVEEEGGPIKPFLDHLEDLRWVLIKCLTSLLVAMALCMGGAPYLISFLTLPLKRSGTKVDLQFLGPMDGFWISMKVALFGGIVIALPFLLYFIGDFILPALKKKERAYFLRAVSIGAGLFLAGAALCYVVMLPISLNAVAQYNTWLGVPTLIWQATEYFSFVSWFMIGMGLSFELPVLVLTLVRLDIISYQTLVKTRRYAFVINLVVCSFITPDPVSTIFMVIPSQILLEVCILIARHWERQKAAAEAAAPKD